MGIKEDIRPVTWMKANAAEMLEQVGRTRTPVVITQNGVPRAVVQDVGSYERMRDAVLMMTILGQGETEARAGKLVPQEEAFARIEKKLRRRKTA
jgi:prevent-host-death family protein